MAIVAVIIHGTYLFGPGILYLLLITYIVSTIAELVSLKTPMGIFGSRYRYHVNHRFFSSGIRFLDVYPIEISLAWVIVKYLSYSLAVLITQAFGLPYPFVIFGTPLILMSLDLILDPVAVNIKKHWTWEKGSAYFGIPLRNFLGWYVVGLISTWLFSLLDGERQISYNILYLLPIIFYGSFLKNAIPLYKHNRVMAALGSVPVFMWTILSLISMGLLYVYRP